VCEARAYAIDGAEENLVASMTGTLMALMPRETGADERVVGATA
jgi:hypothetical protein